MLDIGDTAPDFTLPDQNGVSHTLSSYRGHWVLIYFYPKDNTPGCTKEACMLRDSFPRFEGVHADVFGISADSVASHKRFADKYTLPFPLLADAKRQVISAYGISSRMSFLIDPTGAIKKIYEKVKPEIHAEEVLADLATLGA